VVRLYCLHQLLALNEQVSKFVRHLSAVTTLQSASKAKAFVAS